MNKETVLVLDFGGQYNQLIARRVRDLNVYCEVLPYDASLERIKEKNPIGIIFTGGPGVVNDKDAPLPDKGIFDLGVPILGICYGCQLIGHVLGGKVDWADKKEYGKTDLAITGESELFHEVPKETTCWMSHTYYVSKLPADFIEIAKTSHCSAAIANDSKNIYGVQFHPEVVHTPYGNTILKNFLYRICKCLGNWEMGNYVEETVKALKDKIGDKKVLCALSGGVDSCVTAVMIHKAVGKQMVCILVDHGLMRKNEANDVYDTFKNEFDINIIKVDAEDRFLSKLNGITDPEEKRKIIGEEFIRVFEEEAKKIGAVDFLAQGTIYPDIIESGTKDAAVIKSHHNVGGLPDVIDFEEIIEPLRDLFKDEVRKAGFALGIPENLVMRQPFPGPGLGIRVIGEITKEKLDTLRDVDFIFRDEIEKNGLSQEIWQYFAVLTNLRSVGVMGDERTYSYTVALRAVTSIDAMTADWARIPYDVLEKASNRIVNEVQNVNRIVYDITSKPPATIEWE